MNNTFINLLLIIEGATEKVSQFVMTLKSICNKNIYFVEQKCIFVEQKCIFVEQKCIFVEQNVFLNLAKRLKHSTITKLTIFLF